MKKIGILTFHGADNLGAVLQAYALCEFIDKEINFRTEIIDYECEEVEKTRYVQGGNFVKKIPLALYYRIKPHSFDRFRKKNLMLSSNKYKKENIKKCNTMYSTFVAGSDQIWNIGCSGNDTTYFLDFVEQEKRKISYAASMGTTEIEKEKVDELKNYLNSFDAISVREASSIKKLDLPKDTSILPDPVFLLTLEQWRRVATKRKLKKRYIFVYLIQEDVNVLTSAKKYAKENECDIIINKKSVEFILNNAPDHFLWWIENAEAVFTNSFHGTAFSIIFEKLLGADIILKNGKHNNRIEELLDSAGLKECIISEENYVPKKANAKKWLNMQRKKAYEFLKGNI